MGFLAPLGGTDVSGDAVLVAASATDDVGVTQITLRGPGVTIGSANGAAISATLNTCAQPDGPLTIEATATDTRGQTSTSTVQVTVVNGRDIAPVLAVSPDNHSARLSWTHCSQGSTFDLYWGTDAGVTSASAAVRALRSPFVHPGLTNGVTYSYRLAARTGASTGALSNEVKVVAGQSEDGWSWVDTLPPSVTSLNALWGTGADDVWAVGAGGVTLHWNGATWSPVASGTTGTLLAVHGTGPGDVWAVGEGGLVVRWNGVAWAEVASGNSMDLASVWAKAGDDVWAVGAPRIFGQPGTTAIHWDGVRWNNTAQSSPDMLSGVWGIGSDVWVVGQMVSEGAAIRRWNGTAWATVPSGSMPERSLNAIWGASSSDVWAVGRDITIAHWNGTAWSRAFAPGIGALNAVFGSAANDVWAVGELGAVLHWDGAGWSLQSAPTTNELKGVWSSAPNDVWAVGRGGTLLHRTR